MITMYNESFYDIWVSDKGSILAAMLSNLSADLLAGYNPAGDNVRRQLEDIAAYRSETERETDRLRRMSGEEVEKWCRADLRRRGAIA